MELQAVPIYLLEMTIYMLNVQFIFKRNTPIHCEHLPGDEAEGLGADAIFQEPLNKFKVWYLRTETLIHFH